MTRNDNVSTVSFWDSLIMALLLWQYVFYLCHPLHLFGCILTISNTTNKFKINWELLTRLVLTSGLNNGMQFMVYLHFFSLDVYKLERSHIAADTIIINSNCSDNYKQKLNCLPRTIKFIYMHAWNIVNEADINECI